MCKGTKALLWLAVLGLGLLLAGLSPHKALAATGINPEVTLEGKLVTAAGINIPDGTYNMEFKVYTAATACTPSTGSGCTLGWTEDYLVGGDGGITVTSGTFVVNLGSVCSFSGSACSYSGGNTNAAINWNTNPLYLSMQIGNTSSCTITTNFNSNCGGDNEMKPYILLTATPYALNAGELGGLSSTSYGQLATNQTWTGTNAVNVTSTSAFQIQNSSGAGNLLVANTTNTVLGIGTVPSTSGATLQVGGSISLTTLGGSGTSVLCYNSANNQLANCGTSAGSGSYIYNSTSLQSTANFAIQSAGATSVGGVIEGAASQTADLLDFRSSAGTTLSEVTASAGFQGGNASGADTAGTSVDLAGGEGTGTGVGGNIDLNIYQASGTSGSTNNTTATTALQISGTNGAATFQNGTNSTAAFSVENTSGARELSIDTSNTNLISDPSFDSGTTGWAATGTGASLTWNNTNQAHAYFGVNSLAVNLSTTVTSGAQATSFTQTLAAGTYTFSFYAMGSAALSGLTVSFGSGTCTLNSTTAVSSYFQHYVCTVTTTGTTSAISITTTTTSATLYLDGVQLNSGTTINPYNNGSIELQTTLDNPFVLQPNSNSQSIFQIDTAAGVPIINVDSTSPNLIPNPGFETGTTDWSASGNASIALNTGSANVYAGQASLAVTLGSTSPGATVALGQTLAAGSYTFSFNAKGSVGITLTNPTIGGTTCTLSSGSVVTTAFRLITCSVTAGSSFSSITIPSSTTSGILYIDAVQLTTGSTLQPYDIGAIQLRGVIDSPVALQSLSNSTTAFYVQNTSSLPLFRVDTLNNLVFIGTGLIGENSAIVLDLDNQTSATEPTIIEGGMYYNSTIKAFRCGENGIWVNCGGLAASNTNAATVTNTATETAFGPTVATDQTYTMPANFCQPGRIIHVHAQGYYGITSTAPTLTFRARLDSATGTLLGATNTITPGTVSATNQAWNIDFQIICKTAGTSGTVDSEGWAQVESNSTGPVYNNAPFWPATPPADITVNTTTSHTIFITTQWGTANASNTATMRQFTVNSYGP